jgi:hypothetical protein
MRALIILLSLGVVGLAVSIVSAARAAESPRRQAGERLRVGTLLGDALQGESAVYREQTTQALIAWFVDGTPPPAPFSPPIKSLRRELLDRGGQPLVGPLASIVYSHRLTEHGWFPLMAPEAPEELDRLWVVRAIQPDVISIGGKDRACWRVDAIDPALPPEAETVVAWIDDAVPVFGILRYKRAGETWDLVHSRGAK